MSYNGSGTFNINTAGQPVVTGTVISSSVFNALTADLATGLSTAITKDGQTTVTNNIPFNGYKITNLGAGTASTDAVRLGQLQAGSATAITVTGTDTYTGTMSPALASYTAGNTFSFVVPNTNTTGCTLNIDGQGAKAITRDGSTALIAGDLVAGSEVVVIYDGTRFQVLNSNSKTNWTVSNALTLSAGTANGVAYLNGSKALTTGSALTFDGTYFVLGAAGAFSRVSVKQQAANSAGGFGLEAFADNSRLLQYTDGSAWITNPTVGASGSYLPLAWYQSGTEQMRLTSTGLGIGTSSPAYKLDVNGVIHNNNAVFVSQGVQGNASGFTFSGVGSNYGRIYEAANDRWALGYSASYGGASTEVLNWNSSGNLGLGVTPSAWNTLHRAFQVGARGALWAEVTAGNTYLSNNTVYGSSGYTYIGSAAATQYTQTAGQHQWLIAPSGTAGNAISFTQAMTLDASGNLGLANSSPIAQSSGVAMTIGTGSVSTQPYLKLARTRTGGYFAGLQIYNGASISSFIQEDGDGNLQFGTANTERARITSGGYFKASNSGTYAGSTASYHELYSNASGDWIGYFTQATSSNPNGIVIQYTSTAPNGTGNTFLYCQDNSAVRATIRSNGGLANYQSNNVDLSDIRTKNSITPAASMWDKVAALEIVTYKYNDQTHDDANIGVIAQQVESVEPVWVDNEGWGDTPEDGVPLKTVYTKDITFAAIKALQEAMARIEKLEAEVSALKGA